MKNYSPIYINSSFYSSNNKIVYNYSNKNIINNSHNKISNNDKFKSPEHIANCQKTGADLFHRQVKSKKVGRSFFPESLLKLMDQNPEFYFGKSN